MKKGGLKKIFWGRGGKIRGHFDKKPRMSGKMLTKKNGKRAAFGLSKKSDLSEVPFSKPGRIKRRRQGRELITIFTKEY